MALKSTIETVCSDRYEGYINAVKESLGNDVEVVIDRFHVAQAYRKGADTLRKQGQKRLKKTLTPQEYQALKGLLWAFRKKKKALKNKEKVLLEQAFNYSSDLKKRMNSGMK